MKTTQALILLKNSEIPREIFLEGEIYLRLNDPRRAINSFERLINEAPDWKDKVLKKLDIAGEKAMRSGMDYTAVMIYRKIKEFNPDYQLGEKNFLLGDWYFDLRNYEKSIEYYEKGLSVDSLNKEARFKLAQCYLHRDNLISAYEVLKRGIELGDYWRFKYWLGKTSYRLAEKRFSSGNYTSTELYLGEIISLGIPKVLVDDAYFLLGEIRLSQERYSEAKSCYRKVLQINKFAKPKIVRDARERLEIVKNMEEKN